MDGFNPLDLLASAAELQQKHDDGPERIIITRQRRNNVVKSSLVTSGQKENRELSHNNNNNITKSKPSVVIVKKIKKVDINPEIEKMLDEHNYGNAKRNNIKIDKGSDSVTEINGRKKKRIDSELDNYHNSEQLIQTITTEGQNIDKITTVVSNTSSQTSDSECIHVKCKVDCSDKGACSNRICTCKHETTENKCSKFDEGTRGDCQGHVKINLDSIGLNTVTQPGDSVSRTPDTSIMKYDKQQANCDVSVQNEDGLKLDEQTGEFISKTGVKVLTKSSVNEKENNNSDVEDQTLDVSNDVNCDNEVASEMGSSKTVKSGTGSNHVPTESTSELKKMPYVKVIPSEVSEPALDKQPQTLVINITRGRNSGDKHTTASSMQNFPDSSNECKSSDVGIIRSLLAKNKLGEVKKGDSTGHKKKPVILSIMSPNSKFELPHCSKRELGEKLVSCDSLKELEMSDSVCTDDSNSSVHLLSPDCRNPDSVGIAESPVAHSVSELSYSGDIVPNSNTCIDSERQMLLESPEKCEKGAWNELPIQSETFSAVTSSPLNISESALDLDTPGIETVSEARELNLTADCGLLLTEKADNCDNSANDKLTVSANGNDIPVFRFDSDHCYAGMPGKVSTIRASTENDNSIQSEDGSEAQTPLGSASELSQDSGYEDVTQSPEVEQPCLPIVEESVEKPSTVKNLVPVLVSVNSNGCLTVHDTNLTKTLGGQVFLPENMKVITGTNFSSLSQSPLILSPVAVGKNTSPVLTDTPKLIQAKPESIIGLLSPKTPEINAISNDSQEVSPPKYGKFRIGTFASFSNTGMGIESPTKLNSPVNVQSEEKPKKTSASTASRPGSGKSGKSSPVVDTLGTLVQKVKSSLSPVSQIEMNGVDHIQHDHDYCTKNLMPSVISSFLEARLLSKDTSKGKVTHTKGKKSDFDYKSESKLGKRKRNAASLSKEEVHNDFEVDSESDSHSIPEPLRPKYRNEKYIEPKRTDPKVKITGSSNFQDQFVYFMNTKKRSRRRESKDAQVPFGTDRVFIPPKPGDIVVPHLTDQDIENLRIRSKQSKNPPGTLCCNSLRNEFMAAKLSNGTFSATQPAETVDDEKNIINTILSLENEDLASPVQNEPAPYNESMELYGQGLSADIMNLLPEQMNLTPEQMDLLYSAVDEVQNSSPGLVGEEKLVSTENSDVAFQFPIATFEDTGITSTNTVTEVNRETSVETSTNNGDSKQDTDEAKNKAEEPENVDDEPLALSETGEDTETPAVEEEKISDTICDNETLENTDSEKSSGIPTVTEKSDVAASDGTPETLAAPFSDSGTPGIQTPNETVSSCSDSVDSTKNSNPLVPSSQETEVKTLFPSPNLSNGSNSTSFVSDISSVNSSSITSEISLPQIDKSLDLLGNDFRLFPDASVSESVPSSSVVQPPTQVDYNAPWIVTVSMYWNDLPAIMINNQPFVRLVDIHKQILPAKDTGILKKRCQLMGIEVENCSEMQRYFLVQYGRAFNSKSTLIISKDNAKVLIGYYVDPQPKTTRPEDHHKSIIDHRREQLRRIALARRAAVKAQRLSEKKDEPDPREIKESENDMETETAVPSSVQEQSKNIEVPKIRCCKTLNPLVQTDGVQLKRATRHKKINFLEMLRGDAMSHAGEEETVDENGKKQSHKAQQVSTDGKKKKTVKEKKVKIVKYTIETDSSEETESVESDYSSESYESESTSGSEIQVLKKPMKQHKISPTLVAKVKSRMKTVPKSYNKGSLKVKIGLKKSRPMATSTPVAVQVVNKSTGASKLAPSVYRSKLLSQKSRNELPARSYSPSLIIGKDVLTVNGSDSSKEDSGSSLNNKGVEIAKSENGNADSENDTAFNEQETLVKQSIDKVSSIISDDIALKISPTLPENILDTSELPESKKEVSAISMESVNIQTDSSSFENDVLVVSASNKDESGLESDALKESESEVKSVKVDENRSLSPVVAETSVTVMKRKETVQVSRDETPIRVIHRDLSPQSHQRNRSQLGELFVDHYHNKKSSCVRCYTCRKMMSVDNFLRHLHDVSGGLLSVNIPRTIDLSDPDLSVNEYKQWELFLRKKELFDNNQLPSPDIVGDNMMYVDGDSNHSFPETGSSEDKYAQSGPRIITTPVSPLKKEKIVRTNKVAGKTRFISNHSSQVPVNRKQTVPIDVTEGVRTSSRKRKVKHLYGFEDYSFTKFPRLMKNAVKEEENSEMQ